jgi:hypothetical protein
MKGRKQAIRTAIAIAGPHSPEYDSNGNIKFVRNLECHHCDIKNQQMELLQYTSNRSKRRWR